MRAWFSGALALLTSACAAGRVSQPPPPPPAFEPVTVRSPSPAPSPQASKAPANPTLGGQPTTDPLPATEPALVAPAPSATPSATSTQESAAEPPKKPDTPLGWIAGEPLEPEELLLEWGDAASREMWLVLDKLVASRLARAEAGRLRIRLAPEAVEQRYEVERQKFEQQVARDGKGRTLHEFIERELGFEPKLYLERVRRATIRQMLAERAVRSASLAEESVALRLIVVASDEQKEAVTTALAAGRDYAEVARELSVDDSKKEGGLVPFLAPEERSPLARLAFQTPVGEVAGPLPIAEHHFWIRIEERRTPLAGDWGVIEAPVETSLARFPVGDAEFVHWKLQMERRYPIDLGPLWSLIGAAR